MSISGGLSRCWWQIVFDVDAFGYVVGREADDFVVRELAAIGGEDLRVVFGDENGGFAFCCFLLAFLGNRRVFNGFGDIWEIGIVPGDSAVGSSCPKNLIIGMRTK